MSTDINERTRLVSAKHTWVAEQSNAGLAQGCFIP
jgi:hypothetical protein